MKTIEKIKRWADKYDWRNYIIYYIIVFIVTVFIAYVALSYLDVMQHNFLGDDISRYNFFNLFKYKGE